MSASKPSRTKRPAFLWYPGDWRRDTALQSCSLEARGLWIEMINLMHDGEPYGHLTAGGVEITPAMLATLVGLPLPRVRRLLSELEDRAIFSRTAQGIIYSRRMVRDERIRNVRSHAGRRGGNPVLLLKQKVNQEDNHQVNHEVNPQVNRVPTPAVAVAVAGAVAEGQSVSAEDARVRFTAAANRGLAEHPLHPQTIPPILVTSGRTHEFTEAILAHGIPVDFAEAQIYELARTHKAERRISSLRYFLDAVIRAWGEAKSSPPATSDRPAAAPPLRQRNGRPTPQQYDYPAASDPDQEVRWT